MQKLLRRTECEGSWAATGGNHALLLGHMVTLNVTIIVLIIFIKIPVVGVIEAVPLFASVAAVVGIVAGGKPSALASRIPPIPVLLDQCSPCC